MHLSSPLKPSWPFWRRSGFFAFLLLLLTLSLLLAIVQAQHEVRVLETRYSEKMIEIKSLQEEWGRLSLERNHLTAPARVEQLAIQKLGMKLVQPGQKSMPVIFIKPVMLGDGVPLQALKLPTNSGHLTQTLVDERK